MGMEQGDAMAIDHVRRHLEAENGMSNTLTKDAYGNVTSYKFYDGTVSPSAEITFNAYYASYKLLVNCTSTTGWAETGDGTLGTTANGWIDGSTTVLKDTYTYSAGSSLVAYTTSVGNISGWIGASCNSGYVTVFMKFSDYANVSTTQLRIGSDAAAYQYVTLNSGTDYVADDEWFALEFDLSAGTPSGSPDGTAVDYISFYFTIVSGTTQTIEIYSLMCSKESTTKISGETLFNLRRYTEAYTTESKTFTHKLYYDYNDEVYTEKVTGGY